MTIFLQAVPLASPAYAEAVRLREEILYRPRGLALDRKRQSLDANRTIYGLYRDDLLLGVAVTEPEGEALCITEILIRPDRRRQGLGTSLLRSVERLTPEGRPLVSAAPLSLRPFFEGAGYKAKSKHRGPGDQLRIDFEKVAEKNPRGAVSFFDPAQNRPVLYLTLRTQGFALLPVLRNRFPKEHLFVLDLPAADDMWLAVANRVKEEAVKYVVLAPELAGDRRFHALRDLDLPKAAARFADSVSQTNSVLVLGTEKELKTRVYEAAFEAQNPSLSTVETLIDTEDIRPDMSLDAAFYEILTVHADALKEENFDTVLLADTLLSTRADDIEKFLARRLGRSLRRIDVFDLVASALRSELREKNRIRHADDIGELRIFSETPDRAKNALRLYHPAERSAPVETLR